MTPSRDGVDGDADQPGTSVSPFEQLLEAGDRREIVSSAAEQVRIGNATACNEIADGIGSQAPEPGLGRSGWHSDPRMGIFRQGGTS